MSLENLAGEPRSNAVPGPARASVGAVPPFVIADHELLRCIGRGQYGQVWLARNIMGDYRAVKIVCRDDFASERPFEREFNGIRRFEPISRSHASQLNILHIGKGDGYFYYVMELADDAGVPALAASGSEPRQSGESEPASGKYGNGSALAPLLDPLTYIPRTLKTELQKLPRLPLEQCVEIGLSLATALQHLHEQGLVHRDVKPSNVIFVNGIPKLADIGLVTGTDKTVSFVGTEGFIPPEGPGTIQADIYGLGKVLYEISSGKDRQEFPDPPTQLGQFSDRAEWLELDEIIQKACATNTGHRYQSAEQMRADIMLLKTGKSVRRLHSLERRLSVVKRVGLIGASVTLVVTGGFIWQAHETRKVARLASENLKLARVSQQNAEESRRRLEQTEVAHGVGLLNEGDLLGSLVWFCDAANLDKGEPQREQMHQLRIQSILRECPKLAQLFFHNAPIGFSALSRDGQLLVTASNDGIDKVWDVRTGNLIGTPLHDLGKFEQGDQGASFSRDNRYLATVGSHRTAQIWDVRNGRLVRSFAHPSDVFTVAFSSDGGLLITGSDAFRAWDTHSGKLVWQYEKNGEQVRTFFSPDGRYLAFASGDQLSVREMATGHSIMETPPRPFSAITAAFEPDSRQVVVGGNNGQVEVWDVASGQQIGPKMSLRRAVDLVRLSPDGQLVFAASDTDLLNDGPKVWDLRTGHAVRLAFARQAKLNDASFSPDGRYLAAAGSDGTARIFDSDSGALVGPELRYGGRAVTRAQFTPDGEFLLTTGLDGVARLWNLVEMGDGVRRLRRPDDHTSTELRLGGKSFTIPVGHTEFSSDGRWLLVADASDAQVYELPTFKPIGLPMRPKSAINTAHLSHDGRKVLTASRDGTARIWDWSSGKPLADLVSKATGIDCGFSRDDRLVVTAGRDGTAQVGKVADGRPAGPALSNEDGALLRATISPDNQFVLGLGEQPQLWEIATAKPRLREDNILMPGDSWNVEFSPDGQRFLTLQGTAQVWDTKSGKPITPPLTAEGDAKLSPDGERVATADGTTVEIWDAATGRTLLAVMHNPETHTVQKLAFDRTGRRLATLADDGVRLWNATTGELLMPLLHCSLRQHIGDVAFSPNGRWLLAATGPQVYLWDLAITGESLQKTAERVEAIANRRLQANSETRSLSFEELHQDWNEIAGKGNPTVLPSLAAIEHWHAREAAAAERNGQWEGAIFHLGALIASHPNDLGLRHRRALAYDRTGQWDKAVADDPTIKRSMPLRDPSASPDLLDLSAYYNSSLGHFQSSAAALTSLPAGIQTLDGIPFDVRGAIHLRVYANEDLGPIRVVVNRKCARLHFLHAAEYGDPEYEGRSIGKYVIHYAGIDQIAEVPIVLGRQVLDWCWQCVEAEPWASNELEVAWKGRIQGAPNEFARLFVTTWENPYPNAKIESLELELDPRGAGYAAPLVVAITADSLSAQEPMAARARPANAGLQSQIPPRDSRATLEQIDLSGAYTASLASNLGGILGQSLSDLSNGVRVLDHTAFDIRGVVRLAGGGKKAPSDSHGPWNEEAGFPTQISGIAINQKARRLEFLQACLGAAAGALPGTEVGSYIIHFVDGSQEQVAITYGQDTAHWRSGTPGHAKVAWAAAKTDDVGSETRKLYKQTWTNPFPNVEIQSLDFKSAMNGKLSPFLVAVTAE